MVRFWVDADAEGESTIWTGDPERPVAILRRCEISGDEATRDEVMRRIADAPAVTATTSWRCIANTCGAERHAFSGWEDYQRQVRAHARDVAHDSRWPLTLTMHDGGGRQYAVDYLTPHKVFS